MKQFVSRKYLLTVAVVVLASIALFTGHMDGNAYAAAIVAAQGFYHAANAFDSRTDARYPEPCDPNEGHL